MGSGGLVNRFHEKELVQNCRKSLKTKPAWKPGVLWDSTASAPMCRSPTLGAQVKGLRRLGIFRLGRVRVFVVLCESAKRVWHEKRKQQSFISMSLEMPRT